MLGRRYHWVAKYDDGSTLDQIGPQGKVNAYRDINRDRLAAFEMWEGATMIFHIKFKKGQQLIWRRRVEMTPSGIAEVCHIIGKQENVNGKNYQGIIGLFESDGRIEIAGAFEEGHPWFFPIKTHPDEGEHWQEIN